MPQNIFKKALKDKSGFMAIVAIAIFLLLAIFGATIQMTILDTYSNVKGLNNYYSARDTADGVLEYVNNVLSTKQAGYNISETNCYYGKYAVGQAANVAACNSFNTMAIDPANNGQRDLKIKFSVKGRANDADKLRTTKCSYFGGVNFSANCYVVPFPGTGDAGENCKAYEPSFNVPPPPDAPNNQPNSPNVLPELANGTALDQANYSCNWSRLIFGSSQVDRVSIPFYYDDDGAEPTVNPFKLVNGNAQARNFILRLRTPCKPCGYGDRNCGANVTDETVCDNNQRYVLNVNPDDGGNQIVVQWKLSGNCDSDNDGDPDDNCGMVAVPDPIFDSAIYEQKIVDEMAPLGIKNFVLLKNISLGNYINAFPAKRASFLFSDPLAQPPVEPKLSNFSNPTLSLFLSSALIDTNGKNIPYLEYQVLTDKPIADFKTAIQVDVVVDDNSFPKTIYKEVKKELIDFAVQN